MTLRCHAAFTPPPEYSSARVYCRWRLPSRRSGGTLSQNAAIRKQIQSRRNAFSLTINGGECAGNTSPNELRLGGDCSWIDMHMEG